MARGLFIAPAPTKGDVLKFYQAIRNLPGRISGHMTFVQSTSCWQWVGSKSENGYGRVWDEKAQRKEYAHRYMYRRLFFQIQPGLDIDHLCRNRLCVNPEHLEPVTRAENIRRGIAGENIAAPLRAKTACPKGHPYDERNTSRRDGRRHCRACARLRYHARTAAIRQQLAA